MSVNSYLGVFKHYSSYNTRKKIFSNLKYLNKIGIFNKNFTKYYKLAK